MKIDSKDTLPILVAGVCMMAIVFALIQFGTAGIKESWIVALLLWMLAGVVIAENFMGPTGKLKFTIKKATEFVIAAFGIIVGMTMFITVPVIGGILIPAAGVIAILLAVAAFSAMLT